MGEELRWREPAEVRRAAQKAYRNNLKWYMRPVRHLEWFQFILLLLHAGTVGYILYNIWIDMDAPLDDELARNSLKVFTVLLILALVSGFLVLLRFGEPEVRITRKGVSFRHHLDNKRRLWKWKAVQRAEVARAFFSGDEGRVLQLFFENPKLPPALLGIAPEISDPQLKDILEAYCLPLAFSSTPPQGLEDWQ